MSAFQKLISCYLALSLALAGAVAISPALHLWVEHAGHGPAHAHYGKRTPETPRKQVFAHSYKGFTLPKVDLREVWHMVGHFLASEPAHSPADSEPGHEHHSLSQLLASGLLEQTSDAPSLEVTFFVSIPGAALADEPLLDSRWDAQTATRGPPFRRS